MNIREIVKKKTQNNLSSNNISKEEHDENLIKCNNCGYLNQAQANFCMECGTFLKIRKNKFCPKCGIKSDVNANFCINCGFKF